MEKAEPFTKHYMSLYGYQVTDSGIVPVNAGCQHQGCPCGTSCRCGNSCSCGSSSSSLSRTRINSQKQFSVCVNPSCSCGVVCSCSENCKCSLNKTLGTGTSGSVCVNPSCSCGLLCKCKSFSCVCVSQKAGKTATSKPTANRITSHEQNTPVLEGVALNYSQDELGVRPYYYGYERTPEERQSKPHHEFEFVGGVASTKVNIINGRTRQYSLDKHSFELSTCPTSLSKQDFYLSSTVKEKYYPEMIKYVKKITGAEKVVVIHHQVRNRSKANTDGVDGYAAGIHSDSSCRSAEQLFQQIISSFESKEDQEKFSQGRIVYLNAWRNIKDDPIEQDHLAVLDESSVVKPEDYILKDFFLREAHVEQYGLSPRNKDRHRWSYFPRMKKDEVLFFKQWDSNPELEGRVCFHTSFSDPSNPNSDYVRESIEVRMVLFFPYHQPNTLKFKLPNPLAGDNQTAEGEEEGALESAAKIFNSLENYSQWPSFAKSWLKQQLNKPKPHCYEAVIEALLKDSYNSFNLQNASEGKKKSVKALLEQRNINKTLDWVHQQLSKENKQSNGDSFKQTSTVGLVCFTVGVLSTIGVYYITKRIFNNNRS